MYDAIIVGAGFSGSILARKLAEEKNMKVLVVEQRNHIAGFSTTMVVSILIQTSKLSKIWTTFFEYKLLVDY
jgi:UDP-galactopyranose mutase